MKQCLDGIYFQLAEHQDLSFLSKYGKVFCAFDQNDSGNISFGLVDFHNHRRFVKVAGAKTMESVVPATQAVENLKTAVSLYRVLAHNALIQLIEAFPFGDLYVTVFEWATGECLFDHWNFEKYAKEYMRPPFARFKKLPLEKKCLSFSVLFNFLCHIEALGYVAVDFYDASILYDFCTNTTRICDIDYFAKGPICNDIGVGFPGTKRLKAPEEYCIGATIDSVTNVFTLGALIFHFLGEYSDENIQTMYRENRFFPCVKSKWSANEALYKATLRAVSQKRRDRYQSLKEFHACWQQALNTAQVKESFS